MDYVALTQETAPVACRLFNDAVQNGDMLYRPFTEEEFSRLFLAEESGIVKKAVLLKDGTAFAAGCQVPESHKTYLTMLVVLREVRRFGVGTRLLAAMEQELQKADDWSPRSIEISFFNPMNLTWIVPGTENHDHPNAPGVDMAGSGYYFFQNRGYRNFACQNSYYVDLSRHRSSPDILAKKQGLLEKGIIIETFDAKKYTGMPELMDNLNSEPWRREILGEISKPDGGRPIRIVAKENTVYGFAGPLDKQPSGRGYFAGIGVHSAYRGMGAGKVLFDSLCEGLSQLGAEYMTLFTGENNPARNIYEAAGFKMVRTWADMKKTIR